MEIVREFQGINRALSGHYQGINSNKGLWRYFRQHWSSWFPNLKSRSAFEHQAANDGWHLCHRLYRKVLAHPLCCWLNKSHTASLTNSQLPPHVEQKSVVDSCLQTGSQDVCS